MIWQRLAITTLLTICARFNLTTGGNISIQKPGNQTSEMPYECGRNDTLTCTFKKNTFAIAWMNANDVIPIVKCTRNKCVLTPDYAGQYTFTYEIQGIFNLTIIGMTKEDNERKLICSDGSDNDYEVIKVTDYEPLLFEDTINGTIKAISGCIYKDNEVSFKWIKISVSSGIEEEITPTIHGNYTRCSNDSDCGNDQQVQYTEIISAKSSDNGNYFLKVLAVYGNESKESYSTAHKYIIEEHDKERINDSKYIYFICSIIGVIAMIGLVVVGYYSQKHSKPRKKDREKIVWLRHVEEYTQKKLSQKEKENATSTCPMLEEQDNSRMETPEGLKETTTDPLRHVEEYTQKRLLEKEKKMILQPALSYDKPPANEEDIMERKKDLFERRRLNMINNKESDLNLRESNSK